MEATFLLDSTATIFTRFNRFVLFGRLAYKSDFQSRKYVSNATTAQQRNVKKTVGNVAKKIKTLLTNQNIVNTETRLNIHVNDKIRRENVKKINTNCESTKRKLKFSFVQLENGK